MHEPIRPQWLHTPSGKKKKIPQRVECKRDVENFHGVAAFGVDVVLNESSNWSLGIYVALHVTAARAGSWDR